MARGKSARNDEDIDAAIAEFTEKEVVTPGSSNSALFFVVALFMSVLPLYLYLTIKNRFDVAWDSKNFPYFGLVTVVSTFAMFSAYNAKYKSVKTRLDKESSDDSNSSEATAWTMFFYNSSFLALFFTLAFWMVPAALPVIMNYAISVAGPAVFLYANATGIINL